MFVDNKWVLHARFGLIKGNVLGLHENKIMTEFNMDIFAIVVYVCIVRSFIRKIQNVFLGNLNSLETNALTISL